MSSVFKNITKQKNKEQRVAYNRIIIIILLNKKNININNKKVDTLKEEYEQQQKIIRKQIKRCKSASKLHVSSSFPLRYGQRRSCQGYS